MSILVVRPSCTLWIYPPPVINLAKANWELPLEIEIIDNWRDRGVNVTKIAYASPRDGRVPALLFSPDGASPFAGLVLLHGSPGSKLDYRERE